MAKKNFIALSMALFMITFSLVSLGGMVFAQKAEPITLKVAVWNPPQIGISQVQKEWKKRIEDRCGGRINLKFYWAGALAKPFDVYRTGKSGVAEIIYWVIGFNPGVTPLHKVLSLPFMGSDSMESITKTLHAMYKKFPQLEDEIGLKALWTAAMPPYHFHFTKKEVRQPKDIAGMKLLVGAAHMDMAKELKVVPVQKGPSDWYMSLQRGLVEGHIVHFPAVQAFKCLELHSTHTMAGTGGIAMSFHGMFMNWDVWNKLPSDIQNIILEQAPFAEEGHINVDNELMVGAEAEAKKMGHKMNYLTSSEIEAWIKATEPVHEKWLKEQEAEGRPIAREMYKEAMSLIPKYNKQ